MEEGGGGGGEERSQMETGSGRQVHRGFCRHMTGKAVQAVQGNARYMQPCLMHLLLGKALRACELMLNPFAEGSPHALSAQ